MFTTTFSISSLEKLVRLTTVPLSLNVLLKGQLQFLSAHFRVLGVSGKGADLETVARREKVPVRAVQMQRQIAPLQDLVSLLRLYVLFLRVKPDIVHSITPKAGLLGMLAAKMAGVPVRVHTFTGLVFPSRDGFMQRLLIVMDRLLCWAATDIYPEGAGVKHDLERFRITAKPLRVLANGNINGIDTAHFSPDRISAESRQQLRDALGIRAQDFVFIFVGRLVGDKGINELISAFTQLTPNAPDHAPRTLYPTPNTPHPEPETPHPAPCTQHPAPSTMHLTPCTLHPAPHTPKLLLVGPLETELDPLQASTLEQIDTRPDIISVGYREDVRPYLAIADALVFPSYREGFPNVVMQAGAMGLPAVVSDINGCNEIITDGMNGLIVPPKTVAPLKTAMEQLRTQPALYRQLQHNARATIISRYEQHVVWQALLAEYRRLSSES